MNCKMRNKQVLLVLLAGAPLFGGDPNLVQLYQYLSALSKKGRLNIPPELARLIAQGGPQGKLVGSSPSSSEPTGPAVKSVNWEAACELFKKMAEPEPVYTGMPMPAGDNGVPAAPPAPSLDIPAAPPAPGAPSAPTAPAVSITAEEYHRKLRPIVEQWNVSVEKAKAAKQDARNASQDSLQAWCEVQYEIESSSLGYKVKQQLHQWSPNDRIKIKDLIKASAGIDIEEAKKPAAPVEHERELDKGVSTQKQGGTSADEAKKKIVQYMAIVWSRRRKEEVEAWIVDLKNKSANEDDYIAMESALKEFNEMKEIKEQIELDSTQTKTFATIENKFAELQRLKEAVDQKISMGNS